MWGHSAASPYWSCQPPTQEDDKITKTPYNKLRFLHSTSQNADAPTAQTVNIFPLFA